MKFLVRVKNKLAIEISKENNFDIAQVVERSKVITQKILHNYKDFNLMTIDKFTNKVIRSFSKELEFQITTILFWKKMNF